MAQASSIQNISGVGLDVSSRIINLLLALVLAFPATVIVGFFYLVYLLRKGWREASFIYSGVRLGKNLRPFTMYKIRTLRSDPEFEAKGDILPHGTDRELPLGKMLRESRLDELPQLWNVLRGDMNLVGPRPVRPAVYEQLRKNLPSSETRFRIKPGLTGFAQFLTPSHTPKRIRFAIDNYYINRGPRWGQDLFLIAWTMRQVARKAVSTVLRWVMTYWKIFRTKDRGAEERKMFRYRSKYIWIQFTDIGFDDRGQPMVKIYDINPQAVSFVSSRKLSEGETLYFYLVGCKECDVNTIKRARCSGYVFKSYPVAGQPDEVRRYVVFYEPISPRHRYLVDHYVLHQTVA